MSSDVKIDSNSPSATNPYNVPFFYDFIVYNRKGYLKLSKSGRGFLNNIICERQTLP